MGIEIIDETIAFLSIFLVLLYPPGVVQKQRMSRIHGLMSMRSQSRMMSTIQQTVLIYATDMVEHLPA